MIVSYAALCEWPAVKRLGASYWMDNAENGDTAVG